MAHAVRYHAFQGPFGSSGFKTGPAKSHPNLAKLAFSKLDQAILAGAGFETRATERALNACVVHVTVLTENDDKSIGEYLQREGYSSRFRDD